MSNVFAISTPCPEIQAVEQDAPSANNLRALIRAVARAEAKVMGVPYRSHRPALEWSYRRIYDISGIMGTWELLSIEDRHEMAMDLLDRLTAATKPNSLLHRRQLRKGM